MTNSVQTGISAKCVPCTGLLKPLPMFEIANLLLQLPEWKLAEDRASILREFRARNYVHAMAILNEVAIVAEQEGHHPNHSLTKYSRLSFQLTTFAAKGLTMNDFVMAKLIEEVLLRR